MNAVKNMLEKRIEAKLVQMVRALGGIAPKFVPVNFNGAPDRILLFPGGKMAFVELKALGKKPRPLQLVRHKQLKDLGFKVYVIDSIEQIQGILREIVYGEEEGGDAK